MATDMTLFSVAALLRRGRGLDHLATTLTVLAVAAVVAQAWLAPPNPWLLAWSAALLVLGLLEKYWALRVAFDAELFQRLADDPQALAEKTRDLDQALVSLGLLAPTRTARPWPERTRGALALLRRQALAVGAQALLTLGLLVSFAG